jgi:Septum formation
MTAIMDKVASVQPGPPMDRPGQRGVATASVINVSATRAACAILAVAGLLAGCSVFGKDKGGSKSASVFSVQPGQCFQAPTKVKVELSSLDRTSCTSPHTREAYAVVPYTPPDVTGASSSAAASAYPGSDALSTFAKGACAQRYRGYVGIDYLDSSLFFTYLFPSVRSWEQDDDRKVICFITTTGNKLTSSVKGSKS